MTIDKPTDAFAEQLRRIFDEAPDEGARPMRQNQPQPPAGRDAGPARGEKFASGESLGGDHPTLEAALESILERALDGLRLQLDTAFDEVMDRIARDEERVAALSVAIGELAQAELDVEVRLQERIGLVQQLVDERPPSDSANVTNEEVIGHLEAVNDQLQGLASALKAGMRASQERTEAAVDHVRHDLQVLRDRPITLDTTDLEDATKRGALHNAADIATLRRDVESLAEVVRMQEKGIEQLCTTLDWIKERLLLR